MWILNQTLGAPLILIPSPPLFVPKLRPCSSVNGSIISQSKFKFMITGTDLTSRHGGIDSWAVVRDLGSARSPLRSRSATPRSAHASSFFETSAHRSVPTYPIFDNRLAGVVKRRFATAQVQCKLTKFLPHAATIQSSK